MKAKHSIWLVIIALAFMLWLPNLFTYGMFMDGVINASVAKLYAEGTGTFFNLQERYYTNGAYMGHPPLVFVIQGWFFKIFGSAFYMDKLYSFIYALIQLLLIRTLWLQVVTTEELKKLSWLPCLLWLLAPIISWGYSSNLLENTMSIFTTAALIVLAKYMREGKQLFIYAVLAALLTFAAVLCKGPVALFVLAAPIALTGIFPSYNFKKAFSLSLLLAVALAPLLYGVLLLPEGKAFVTNYIDEQLQPSVDPQNLFVLGRAAIILYLLKALSVPLIVTVVIALTAKYIPLLRRFNNTNEQQQGNSIARRFLLLGLCATLPIMISNKQSAFYTIPAIPVFAIAFAAFIAPVVSSLYNWFATPLRLQILGAVSALLVVLMLALSASNYGTILRDKDMLEDAAQINALMKEEVEIGAPYDINNDYIFKAYMNRLYGKVVYTTGRPKEYDWYIAEPHEHEEGAVYRGRFVDLYKK